MNAFSDDKVFTGKIGQLDLDDGSFRLRDDRTRAYIHGYFLECYVDCALKAFCDDKPITIVVVNSYMNWNPSERLYYRIVLGDEK